MRARQLRESGCSRAVAAEAGGVDSVARGGATGGDCLAPGQALEIEFPLQAPAYRAQLLQGWPVVDLPAASTTSKRRAAAAPAAAAEPDAQRRRRAELEKFFDVEAEGEDDNPAVDLEDVGIFDVDDQGNLAGLVADSDEDNGGFDGQNAAATRRASLAEGDFGIR